MLLLLRQLSTGKPSRVSCARSRHRKYEKGREDHDLAVVCLVVLRSPRIRSRRTSGAEIPRVPRRLPRAKRDTAAIYKGSRLVIAGVLITAAKKHARGPRKRRVCDFSRSPAIRHPRQRSPATDLLRVFAFKRQLPAYLPFSGNQAPEFTNEFEIAIDSDYRPDVDSRIYHVGRKVNCDERRIFRENVQYIYRCSISFCSSKNDSIFFVV